MAVYTVQFIPSGSDVGFGFGWKLLAGAVSPVTVNSQFAYYLYIDSTGAEYRLDQNSNNVWTSLQGTYVSYDANAQQLHFNDGSFWTMACTSASSEADAGTLYPTTMQDANGNSMTITYMGGIGTGGTNSSARPWYIKDSRSTYTPVLIGQQYMYGIDYVFSYNTDLVPHLTGVTNYVQTTENYTFSYLENQPLASPFTSAAFPNTTYLQSVAAVGPPGVPPLTQQNGQPLATSFQYAAGSGEMTQMTTPLGGTLSWQYRTFTYPSSGISLREVLSRTMGQNTWNMWHSDGSDTYYHIGSGVNDTGAGSWKDYYHTSIVNGALVVPYSYVEQNETGSVVLLQKYYSWAQPGGQNPYVSQTQTTLNPYTSYAAVTTTTQTIDGYGNLTQQQIYDYGNPNTPAKTYNSTYYGTNWFNSGYIRNRVNSATVTTPSGNTTLGQYTYDGNGNVTNANELAGTTSYQRDSLGNPTQITDGAGSTWNITGSVATPSAITPGGNSNLTTTISYASSWAVTSVTGPNAANATTTYDQYGRPSQSTIPDGATTTYTYTYNPNMQTAALGSQWKKTTLDGFGRTLSVQTGHDSTTVSEVDTQYAPCGCSPLGKVSQVSLPYTPGQQNPVWTVYTYDTSGRTLTVTKPDGASKTTYSYRGNTTTVTDPAGKWKTLTTDAFGNLTTVTEPDPNNPASATYVTTYTYNVANQLIQVYMPRNGTIQTRTFTWSGSDLASATNPENGTVTYQYDGAHHVTQRTDAKNQQTQYSYDVYGRLTEVRHGTLNSGSFSEILNQRVDYYYDASPSTQTGQVPICAPSSSPSNSYNLWGRLAAVVFADENTGASYNYAYAYNQAGRVTGQCMTMSQVVPKGYYQSWDYASVMVNYTWDNQGRMTSLSYPGQFEQTNDTEPGPVNSYTYDAMGNLASLSQQCSDCTGPGTYSPISANATYNQAGQLTGLIYGYYQEYQETRGYNSLLQLTTATAAYASYPYTAVMNMQYNYSATQNNGRIVNSVDGVAGQHVSYSYDALNRLVSAATNPTDPGAWGQSYSYDGFGNLLAQVPTQGSAPSAYPPVDSTTNHVGQVDANGNPAGSNYIWDVENRPLSYTNPLTYTTYTYTYDPWGKRIVVNGLVYLYGIDGKPLATYQAGDYDFVFTFQAPAYFTYFGGKLLTPTDRLGSVHNQQQVYFPWGQEQTSTPDQTFKFAGYWRDETGGGVDYADQRYYKANYGRFWTPDPGGHANLADPQSFNQYAYVGGDPVNNIDPSGLCSVMLSGITMGPSLGTAWNTEAVSLGADTGYPYNGEGTVGSILSVMGQASAPNDSTTAALNAILYALSSNSGPISIVADSGGAGAFTAAYSQLSAAQQARIGSVLYIAPGADTTLAAAGTTTVLEGPGAANYWATFFTKIPSGASVVNTNCSHTDLACWFAAASSQLQAMASNQCSSPEVFTRTTPAGVPGMGFPSSSGGGSNPNQLGMSWEPVYGAEGDVTGYVPVSWSPSPIVPLKNLVQ
jgi:RHS repeat-associated protein